MKHEVLHTACLLVHRHLDMSRRNWEKAKKII